MGCRQLLVQSDDVQVLLVLSMYLHGILCIIVLLFNGRLEHSHLRLLEVLERDCTSGGWQLVLKS